MDNQLTVEGFDYPWDEWHYKGTYLHEPLYHPQHHHHRPHYYYDDDDLLRK